MKPSIEQMMNTLPQVGRLTWIGLRPARREELEAVSEAEITTEEGLLGDHYQGKRNKNRQITLIQQEHLDAVASMLGLEDVPPTLTRRNLVVQGINLLALKGKKFRIGEVILEGTGLCHPCSRMEENLGPGGYNAMRGHGGLTAKVTVGGEIHLSDEVAMMQEEGNPNE